MRKGRPAQRGDAFTLVELILVMALLATLLAFSAPSLSRSMRDRHLKEHALRFLALIEYGREEAISQGVPMVVWIDPGTHRFGVEPKPGFPGDSTRRKSFATGDDIRFEIGQGAATVNASQAIELTPAGIPELHSAESVRLIDRHDSVITVARSGDRLGYEIVKETR